MMRPAGFLCVYSTGFGCSSVSCFRFWLGGWAFHSVHREGNCLFFIFPLFESYGWEIYRVTRGVKDTSAFILALNSTHVTISIVLYSIKYIFFIGPSEIWFPWVLLPKRWFVVIFHPAIARKRAGR